MLAKNPASVARLCIWYALPSTQGTAVASKAQLVVPVAVTQAVEELACHVDPFQYCPAAVSLISTSTLANPAPLEAVPLTCVIALEYRPGDAMTDTGGLKTKVTPAPNVSRFPALSRACGCI
jgi:hypothetical protein